MTTGNGGPGARLTGVLGTLSMAVLTVVSLSACGGDNGDTATTGRQAGTAKNAVTVQPATPTASSSQSDPLSINPDNAPAVIDQLLLSSSYLPKTIRQFYRSTYAASCGDGSVKTGGAGAVQSAILERCVILDDKTGREEVNGAVRYELGDSQPGYPVSARFDDLTLQHIGYDDSGALKTLGRIRIDGHYNNTAANTFSGSGSFYLGYLGFTEPGSGDSGVHDWRFEHYHIVNDALAGPKRLDGRIAFATPAGYVDVATGMALSYSGAGNGACPLTGALSVTGGDGTRLGLAFDGGSVTVTVNGNADTYSCQGFDAWLGDTAQPFAPRRPTPGPTSSTARSYSY